MVDEVKNKICYTVNRYAVLIVSLLNPISFTNPCLLIQLIHSPFQKKNGKKKMLWTG